MSFVGLLLVRMSGCCSVERRITVKLGRLKCIKIQYKYDNPNCGTYPELHQYSYPDPT